MPSIQKRLRPLFIADFFAGLMFFYPVTFPFMHHEGLTTTQIGAYVAISNIVVLLLEIPSGILADRWSRKRVIMLGLVSIAVAMIIFCFAHSFAGFALAAIFMSANFALRSGMHEAMIYDVLFEQDQRQAYEQQLGRLRAYTTAGNVVSSLLGALMAAYISFQSAYYASFVSCLLALVLMQRFKEPQLHRQVETTKLLQHIVTLFRSLSQHRAMKLLVATNILIGIEFCYMLQIDPLWPIALGLATAWYGPLNAFLLSSQGVAAPLADRVAKSSRRIQLLMGILVLSAAGLLLRNIYVIALSEFTLLAMATTLMVVLSGRIQDELPSSQRSGVESAISTLSTLAFMGSLLIFLAIARTHSVFVAAWVLLIVAILGAIGVQLSLIRRRGSGTAETLL